MGDWEKTSKSLRNSQSQSGESKPCRFATCRVLQLARMVLKSAFPSPFGRMVFFAMCEFGIVFTPSVRRFPLPPNLWVRLQTRSIGSKISVVTFRLKAPKGRWYTVGVLFTSGLSIFFLEGPYFFAKCQLPFGSKNECNTSMVLMKTKSGLRVSIAFRLKERM